ncbi:DUF5606 domain-containing protein [Flavobacteriaceae bacterium F08102]|nr:DUF5606 domain-containing protein [Flavobacteriaceae bacterium F08102]
MELNKVVAIVGKPGIYKIVSQTKGGLIVQSLSDNKKMPVNAIHNVSVLNDIAIYTYEEEVPLRMVFKEIAAKNDNAKILSHKSSNEALISFFKDILPSYDEERVYPSNIKKVVQWYNILVEAKFDFSTIKEENESDEEE